MLSLITGANGFIGSHLARFLVEQGEQVRALVRPQSDLQALNGLPVEFAYADLREASSLPSTLKGVQRVYHVAADYRLWAKNPQEIYDSNVTGTRNLLAAARQAGIDRFIYTSSVGTLVPRHPGKLPDEQTHLRLDDMIGHYKRSKFLAEQEALEAARYGQPVVIVNPTTPVGPGDWKPTPTGRIILDFLNGQIPAYVDTGLNFVAVEDVARGHWLAAERGKVGERYILGDRNLTLKQMLEILSRLSGRPAATRALAPCGTLPGFACGHARLAPSRAPAAHSPGRRAPGSAQNVCGWLEGHTRVGIRTRPPRSRLGARHSLVL